MRIHEQILREIGTASEEALGAGDDARGFSLHLAAHAVMEETLTGHCTKTLNMSAPCPYCGKLPPGMAFPSAPELAS